MDNNIYKRMVKDSPMAYLYIKAIKDEDEDYIGLKIIDLNKSFEAMFNTKLEKIKNKVYLSKDYEGWNKKWEEILKKASKSEKYIIREYIESSKIYSNIEIYSNNEDEFALMIMEVKEEYMKLSSTLKNSSFIAWIKDRSGRYVDVNKPCEEKMKMCKSNIIGKSDYEIYGQEIGAIHSKEDKKVMKENKMYTYEQEDLADPKSERYYQIAKWVYTDKYNNTLGTIGIAIEITDKVRLKKNIENNEKNFLEIAEHIEEVFFITNRERALYISPSFEKVFEHSPENLFKDISKLKDYINYEDIIQYRDYDYDEALDITFRLKSDNEKWIWCKSVPIKDENGQTIKRVGIVSDITKKKELEKQLDNLRMDFFANLSHELRTPINLVLSCVQVLSLKLNKLERENQEYYSKYLNILNQNGLRLLKLVNNLIDTTKIDAGHFSYNPENYDIVSFVENICTSVSDFIKRNNLSIVFDTNCEEKIVAFDLNNMERIILNLLSNAIKFNKTNGKIEVSIDCRDNIKIRVKDNGVGIPKEKLESIFGRFEQVKTKINNDQEGSGIGLSLVKSLVEIHNGTINVNSEIGEGSEFVVTLPNVLVEEHVSKECITKHTIKNVNIMDVEFSDIYY